MLPLPAAADTETEKENQKEKAMNIIKHTDFEIRAFAYEKAMTIPLAKLYFKFLKEASSEEDFAMRVNSIELRAGLSMTDVEELYGFFSGFLDE